MPRQMRTSLVMGGSTINGDDASGGNLILLSTSHATKGQIQFGASALAVWDDVNGRLGIYTTTPVANLHVRAVKPAAVATATGTAAAQVARFNGDNVANSGGDTTIATTGAGGGGAGSSRTGGTGGLAGSAATSATGGAGGSLDDAGGAGADVTQVTSTVAQGGAGGQLNQLGGVGGAVSGANTGTAANTKGGLGGQLQYTGGAGGAESNGVNGGFGGAGGQVFFSGGQGGASTTGTGGGTHTGGDGGRIIFAAGRAGAGSSANGAPGVIAFTASTGTTANATVLTVANPTITVADAINLAVGTTTGTKIGTATTQKIGFYNATPVVQQTDGAALTNNVTAGGTTNTIDNWTNLTTYATDAAAIRNAVYQLARKLKIVDDALRTYGLLS